MKNLSLLVLLMAVSGAFAQIKFEPGTITKNDGSTLACFIKNLAWINTPESFEYKLSETGTTATGTVADIAGFEVSGYHYQRFTVDIERSSVNYNTLDRERNPQYKKETLFLEVVTAGKLSLYAYETPALKKYFIKPETDKVPTQLLYKLFKEEGHISEINYYRQQLYNATTDKGYSTSDFERIQYNKKQLLAFVQKYNGVTAEENTVKTVVKNKSNYTFHLKAQAGYTISHITIGNGDIMSATNNQAYDFKQKSGFLGGIEAEVVLPFNQNKWSVFTSPFYNGYESNEQTTDNKGWKVKYNTLSIPVGIRYYMFLNNKSKLFLNGGFMHSMLVGKNYLTYDSFNVDFSNSFNGFAGVGYNFANRVSAELRYNTNRETIDYVAQSAKFKSFNIILYYTVL